MKYEPSGPRSEPLQSSSLLLVPFTLPLMHAAIAGRKAFERELSRGHGVGVADDWPNPDFADALPFIAGRVEESPGLESWQRLIVERSTARVVGEIGFKALPIAGSAEIGYGICESARGNSYASEAARLIVGWALARPEIKVVTAECLPSNAASIRVLEKVGFIRDRSTPDMHYWSLRRSG